MSKRALRRHHKARMKQRARKVAKIWGGVPLNHLDKHADHLAMCSCEMCGNPRRHHGERTIQELRWLSAGASD